MSTVEEAGLAAIHLAVLRGDRDALVAELATMGAHRAKTTAMVTSHPPKRDNRVFRPGSGFFFPPEPLESIGANRAFDKGASPLHLAAAIGDLHAVETLFAHKARASKDGVGATLLHLAAIGGHFGDDPPGLFADAGSQAAF